MSESMSDHDRAAEVFVFESLDIGEAERQLILRALERTANNRKAAAALLGIHARTLRRKLREYAVRSAAATVEIN